MTTAEWQAQLDACGGDLSQDALVNLLYARGPNALFSETVMKMHDFQPFSNYRYFSSLLPTRVWKDWQGTTEQGTVYHPAHIPFNLGVFQRSMQICDPSSLNECHTDYCEIPRGGVTSLPELEMYKAGFKTERMCIANIRTSNMAKQIARLIIDERFNLDEQIMSHFYTMAVIRMLGHKWVLEGTTDADGQITPVANANPYNALGGYRYSYMQPLFPQVGNLENVLPLDFFTLDSFGRALTTSRNPNFIARGPRNTPIFSLWHGDDWYKAEMLDNPEWVEKMKVWMDYNKIPGYTMEDGQGEIVGNFAFHQMPGLPRFAESTAGGLTIVQEGREVAVDTGNRVIHNWAEWDNAPFIMTIALGKNIGEMLSRPSITEGIEGRPIMPINGNGDWVYRNDYDKDCNPDLNMPYFQKRYEMGFRMLNPDAGWGFISRARKFRLRPLNTCSLRPLIKINPVSNTCSIVTIGCNPLNDRVPNTFMQQGIARKVLCSGALCGADDIYRVTIRRENIDSISPGENPFELCQCGDSITLNINNASNVFQRQETGTIIDFIRPNTRVPHPVMLIQLDDALEAGECIASVDCPDATPGVGTVVACVDNGDDDTIAVNSVKLVLDSQLDVDTVGDDVEIKYYDAEGTLLDTINGDIVTFNHETYTYKISVRAPDTELSCESNPTAATVTVNAA